MYKIILIIFSLFSYYFYKKNNTDNVIIIILMIISLLFYIAQINRNELLTNTEAIATLGNMFNNDTITVSNLNVTGNITCGSGTTGGTITGNKLAVRDVVTIGKEAALGVIRGHTTPLYMAAPSIALIADAADISLSTNANKPITLNGGTTFTGSVNIPPATNTHIDSNVVSYDSGIKMIRTNDQNNKQFGMHFKGDGWAWDNDTWTGWKLHKKL